MNFPIKVAQVENNDAVVLTKEVKQIMTSNDASSTNTLKSNASVPLTSPSSSFLGKLIDLPSSLLTDESTHQHLNDRMTREIAPLTPPSRSSQSVAHSTQPLEENKSPLISIPSVDSGLCREILGVDSALSFSTDVEDRNPNGPGDMDVLLKELDEFEL